MRKITGFALLAFASVAILPMTCINLHYVDKKNGNTAGYFYDTAKNVDIWANREFRATWNARLVQAVEKVGVITYPYKFGVPGETISSALGKNQLQGTLSKEGWRLVRLLERFEKEHCVRWIDTGIGEWVDPR